VGENNEGYFYTPRSSGTWDIESDLKNMPVKSAFSKCEDVLVFEFFKTGVDQTLAAYEPQPKDVAWLKSLRNRWRPLRVATNEGVVGDGYVGYAFSKTKETYCPQCT